MSDTKKQTETVVLCPPDPSLIFILAGRRPPKPKRSRYFEEYRCGCVSEVTARKRDLLGYCPKHGDDRRHVYPVG